MKVVVLPLLLLLGGCSGLGTIVGVVAGGITGGATGNPAVGFAVGVGTAALSDFAQKHVAKSWHTGEQDAIADTAGPLPAGARVPWQVRHSLPIGNEHGELQVIRQIDNPLAPCKEIVFSVVDDKDVAWYSTSICQQGERWKWASAEPAVERWGFLQ